MTIFRMAFFVSPNLINLATSTGNVENCNEIQLSSLRKHYFPKNNQTVCVTVLYFFFTFFFLFFSGVLWRGEAGRGMEGRSSMFSGAISVLDSISHMLKLSIWLTSPRPVSWTLKMCRRMSGNNSQAGNKRWHIERPLWNGDSHVTQIFFWTFF